MHMNTDMLIDIDYISIEYDCQSFTVHIIS